MSGGRSTRRDAPRRASSTQATAAGVNPYKGLRPFDEADAAAFFGRERRRATSWT